MSGTKINKIFYNRIKGFIRNKKGSVTIEFFFSVLLFAIMFAFMVDLIMIRSSLGKLDNASYTLVNLLRERKNLYSDRPNDDITSLDVQQYKELAKLLLFNDKNDKSKVYLILEYKASETTRSVLGDSGQCAPYSSLDTLWALSPRSESSVRSGERKVPLYQVTICIETGSLFKALLVDKSARDGNFVRSSSFSVAR
jgi:tadF